MIMLVTFSGLIKEVRRSIPIGSESSLVITVVVTLVLIIIGIILSIRSRRLLRLQSAQISKQQMFYDDIPITRPPRGRYWWLTALVLPLVIALMWGNYYTDTPSFCRNCHQTRAQYRAWKRADHRRIACRSCHQRAGITGYLLAKAEGFRNLSITSSYYGRFRPAKSSPIDNNVCLSCHAQGISRTIVKRNIKVSHKELIEEKIRCSSCHQGIWHPVRKYQAVGMERCTLCHNGKSASNDCDICHLQDIGAGRHGLDDYPKIEFTERLCSGCHPKPDCRRCHFVGIGGVIEPKDR